MSTDNSGIVLIGQQGNTQMLTELLSSEQESDASAGDLRDWFYLNAPFESALLLEWQLGEPCGYEASGLAGFYIESPSYGSRALPLADFLTDGATIAKLWNEHMGNDPEVFVLNLQS